MRIVTCAYWKLGDLAVSKPEGPIGGYECESCEEGLRLTWPTDDGAGPPALLYRKGTRLDDIIVLNNFLYQEGCYAPLEPPNEHILPPLAHVHPGAYRCVPDPDKTRPLLHAAIAHLEPRPPEWTQALGLSLIWWLEGAKSSHYESQINAMRTAFEALLSVDRVGVEAALVDIHTHLRSLSPALPAEPSVKQHLVVGRQIRNAATHSARLDPGDRNTYGQTYAEAAVGECIKPHKTWLDGHASLSGAVEDAFHGDWYRTAFDAIEFCRFVLYGVLLKLLGLPLGSIEFIFPPDDDRPNGWLDVVGYIGTFRFG